MGCCGSTVRVHEMKASAESSDEDFDAEEQVGHRSSDAALKLKEEARSMFTMVDAGACPSYHVPASRVSRFANRRSTHNNSLYARLQTGVATSIAPSSSS